MKRPKLFPGLIFGLLAANATVVGITVFFAHSDKSFAVEPEYYQKALHWDDEAKEQAQSQDLGWRVGVDPGAVGAVGRHVRITIHDREGKPVEGARVKVTAFSALRAADRFAVSFDPVGAGVYRADMSIDRPGRWEFVVRATRGTDVCAQRIQVSVQGPPS